jgi:hypothetical protein
MGSLLSIGDTDISEDVVGSFSLHASAVSTPVTQDGAHCSLCITFRDHPGENPRYNEFVTVPYKDWKNALGEKRGRLALHSNSECHLKALDKAVYRRIT